VRQDNAILLGFTGAIALAALLPFLARTGEPRVDGRLLSEWLALQSSPAAHYSSEDQAHQALKQMGTNALPFLIRWIKAEPTPWCLKLARFVRYQNPRWATWLEYSPHQIRADLATYALCDLGDQALPAISDLTRMASNSAMPCTARRASDVLSALQKNSVPGSPSGSEAP
jgi:hypothetical protein